MNRTERFLGGVFFGYAQQTLTVLTGLWLTPFLLHRIGQRDYGLWLVGLQLLTWLTLLDFGIVALLPRETAYAVGRAGSVENAADLPRVIAQTSRVVLWQWPFVALAASLCCFLLPPASHTLRGPIALVVGAFAIVFPLRIFRAVLEGVQDLHFLGRVQIASWATGILLSVSLVLAGFHLYALAAGWATTQILVALACFARLKQKYPYALPARLSGDPVESISAQFGRGFWVSLAQIAQVLLDGTDLLVVGKTLGPRSVVPYSCTEKLIGVLSNQPLMLMQAASPGLSAIKSSGNRAHAFQVVMSLTQGMLMLSGAVVCAVLAVNRGFVAWWVGPHQFAGFPLTLLLAAAMLLRHWNSTAVYSIFCFGYERRISITTLIDGIVSVAASLLLVRRFGFIGAPLGSMLGVCLISLPANLSALSHESGKSVVAVVLPLWPWFWRFLILAAGSGMLSILWNPTTAIGVGLAAFLVVSIYAAAMFPMLVRSPLRAYLPGRIVAGWNRFTGAQPSLAYPAVED